MRIFRGPASQQFDYTYTPNIKTAGGLEHEQVDNIDFGTETESWSGEKLVRFNVSKDSNERQSVGHIVFKEEDITALHGGLMKGLQEKRRLAEEAFLVLSRLDLDATVVGITQEDISMALSKIHTLLK